MDQGSKTFPQNSNNTHSLRKKKKSSSTDIFALAMSRMKNEVHETVEGPTVLNFLSP